MKGDREKCPAGGMDGYLRKPIRPQELDEVLRGYVRRREETKARAIRLREMERIPEERLQ